MRIGIDIRYLSHGSIGGVHTYVANFVPALIAQAPNHQIVLYGDTKRPLTLPDLPSNVVVRLLPWHGPLWSCYNDLFMRRQLANDQLDVMHYPANFGFSPPGVCTLLTLHDVINIMPLAEIVRGHRKNPRTIAMMCYLHYLTRLSLRHAHTLLTVSAAAGREIARYSGFRPERIVPVPHAPTSDLRRITDPAVMAELRQRFGLPLRFILADALKNPATVIRAWRLLPAQLRADRAIVFFSRRADPLPVVHEAVERGEARLLVRPSREDLIALYSGADAFVFPSWIEGFGIPVLEAMTCGTPVVASDRGSIPEVTGDAALLADAEDGQAFARHISAVLANEALAQDLRRRGLSRAAQFSWQHTAQRILETYERAASHELRVA